MIPLFDSDSWPRSHERLEEGAVLLRGFATSEVPALLEEVARIAQAAPFRHLVTPGGYTMSVAMTNCGRVKRDSFSSGSWPARAILRVSAARTSSRALFILATM